MSYQSLYRRFRPRRFADIKGQDHIVTALQNSVRENRVGHAYLFSGPRGTGKSFVYQQMSPYCHLISGGQTTTAVSGYGDEAFSSVLPVPGSVGVTTLVARKGDVEVLISAPTALGPVENLMQKILSQF